MCTGFLHIKDVKNRKYGLVVEKAYGELFMYSLGISMEHVLNRSI